MTRASIAKTYIRFIAYELFHGIINSCMSDLCLAVPMEDVNKKEKRVSVSISLTDSERDELRGCA